MPKSMLCSLALLDSPLGGLIPSGALAFTATYTSTLPLLILLQRVFSWMRRKSIHQKLLNAARARHAHLKLASCTGLAASWLFRAGKQEDNT